MSTASLLDPGTVVRLKTCRHCIEKWIIARREFDDRGVRREPSVHCSEEHLRGTVMPYDMQYSRGVFPVRFDDGIWRLEMAVDVWVVVPETGEEPAAATVVKIHRSQSSGSVSDRVVPARRVRTA